MMRAVPLCLLYLAAAAAPLSAQVGYAPDQSPYRDIPPGHLITPLVGLVAGGGGPLSVGPHDGVAFGGRYEVRANRSLGLGLTVTHGQMDRLIVNPFVKLANRTTGPVQQAVTFADLSAQLNLSGGKSWHRLAPFAGLSGGMAFASATPADTSGYQFGSKFYVAPFVGTRLMITGHVVFRADAQAMFWKLTYPSSFAAEPVEEPGTAQQSNAVRPGGNLRDWVLTPVLHVGLGYLVHW